TVQKIENGTGYVVQPLTVQLLAAALGCDVEVLVDGHSATDGPRRPGILPPYPPLFVGRLDHVGELKRRLGVLERGTADAAAAGGLFVGIHGWPGVGKSTVLAALAYDDDVLAAFPTVCTGSPPGRTLAQTNSYPCSKFWALNSGMT